MRILDDSRLMLGFVFSLLFIEVAYSSEQVIVEFLYLNPINNPHYCEVCPPWIAMYNEFSGKNDTVNSIRRFYAGEVILDWIDITSDEGKEKQQLYGVSPNAIVINSKIKIEGNFDETYIKEVIDSVLEGSSQPSQPSESLMPILAIAFSFGFIETFSPCLIILLSFVLSYTIGETSYSKESFLRVMIFGTGFTSATLLLAVAFGLLFLSTPILQHSLTWIVCVFAVVFGLNLLGVLRIPSKMQLQSKPLIRKLARKYVITYAGLFLLGFVFYFLDPCIAPIFVAVLPLFSLEALPLIFLVFYLGVILPFCFIGILAGSICKLARGIYRHKPKIRTISALILIAYALYLIFFYLL